MCDISLVIFGFQKILISVNFKDSLLKLNFKKQGSHWASQMNYSNLIYQHFEWIIFHLQFQLNFFLPFNLCKGFHI
jgi:hypothetical protein